MTVSEIRSLFSGWREKHARVAWTPLLSSEGGGSSWFGGIPAESTSGDWPHCAHCSAPMDFLLQLDFGSLPAESIRPLDSGCLQLFYCSTDDGGCPTWEPFSGTAEFRVVTEPVELFAPAGRRYKRVVIDGWERAVDYPSPAEHESLGLVYDYDHENRSVSVTCSDPPISALSIDIDAAELIADPADGEKLRGWPLWVQGPEYPSCPKCADPMDVLLQIDSNRALERMWGDAGVAHITQCHKHPTTFAFAWACS